MKLSELNSAELLSYSTILENIVTTNIEMEQQMKEAVEHKFCLKEEIETIFLKCVSAREEADEIYAKIQKELDLRAKRDLGMKYGIRRTQSIINELHAFIDAKNAESKSKEEVRQQEAIRISGETVASLNIVEDDFPSE